METISTYLNHPETGEKISVELARETDCDMWEGVCPFCEDGELEVYESLNKISCSGCRFESEFDSLEKTEISNINEEDDLENEIVEIEKEINQLSEKSELTTTEAKQEPEKEPEKKPKKKTKQERESFSNKENPASIQQNKMIGENEMEANVSTEINVSYPGLGIDVKYPSTQERSMEIELWNFELKEKQLVTFKKTGQQWMGLCPWHNDTRPSLQAYPDEKRFHCHGCEVKGAFYDPKCEPKNKMLEGVHKENVSLKGDPESIFEYRNEKDEMVFQVLRHYPKNFKVRRRNPNFKYGDEEKARWIWDLKGINPLPYRLPELIKGSDPVFIPEGEKHVDELRKMGLTATCNPFGAGKWKEEFNEYLKGRELIILCDNDKPGLDHGSLIASSNYKTAKSIKMPILPGLPEKGDILDYLNNGGTRESLLEIIEQTPFYSPLEDPNKLHYRIRTIDEVLQYPEPQYIIEKILVKETLNIIASYAGVGKSVIALSVAKSILTGQPLWNHFNVIEKGAVLLIDEETPRPFLRERIEKMHFDYTMPFYFIHFENVKIDTDEGMEALNEDLDRIKPKVLIIDSFIRIHNQDENKSKDMARVMDRLRKIVNQGVIVVLIAHHGKGEDRPKEERLRGTSDIPAGIDVEYSLVDKSDGGRAGEKIVEFRSVKTRTKPIDPIRLKMTFTDEIRVEYEGTKTENLSVEIVSALAEKKIRVPVLPGLPDVGEQPVSELNPAKISDIETWLNERGITTEIRTVRRAIKELIENREICGRQLKDRGHPWVYWLPSIEGTGSNSHA